MRITTLIDVFAGCNAVNLNLLHLPSLACATPHVDFYASYVGFTMAITGFCCYIAAFWCLGMLYATWRGLDPALKRAFSEQTLFRLLKFLKLIYAPICETVVSVFSCTAAGADGVQVLLHDSSQRCYTAQHMRHFRYGIFMLILFPFGVPALYAAVLYRYRIPHFAAGLMRAAELRQLVKLTCHLSPACEDVTVQRDALSADHIDVLFQAVFKMPPVMAAAHDGASPGVGTPLSAEHDRRLEKLLSWARARSRMPALRWDDERRHFDGIVDVHVFRAARRAIGLLFEEFVVEHHFWVRRSAHGRHWPFCVLTRVPAPWQVLAEALLKIVLTSVLAFVAPGTPLQVCTGLFLTFVYLQMVLRAQPHADRLVAAIAASEALLLFLFFFFALLIKMQVLITSSSDSDDIFFSWIIGVLSFSVVAVPATLILYKLLFIGLDHEEEEDELQELEEQQEEQQGAAKDDGTVEHGDDDEMKA